MDIVFETVLTYLKIAGASAGVYLFLIASIRIFGRKEFSQLSTYDIIFILLISNAVQHSMLAENTTLMGGVVSALSLFLVNSIFKHIIYKNPKLSRLLQGHPIMLIYDGVPLISNMNKAKINHTELEAVIREHGILKVEDVSLAVLEANGFISVLAINDDDEVTARSRNDIL